jgi:hypothetical protein
VKTLFGYPLTFTVEIDGRQVDISHALDYATDPPTLCPQVVSEAIIRAQESRCCCCCRRKP